MANYNATIRTNYFSVTDEERLRSLIQSCSSEYGDLLLFEDDEGSGKFAFGCNGVINGLPQETGEDNIYDYDLDGFFSSLQDLLPDGEACILTEVGFEKLRYLIGISTIITNTDIQSIDLRSEAIKRAGTMLGNKAYTTKDEY